MIKAIPAYRGVQLSSDIWISDIEYADNVVILAENFENLNFILERVNYFSKTKVLSPSQRDWTLPRCDGLRTSTAHWAILEDVHSTSKEPIMPGWSV